MARTRAKILREVEPELRSIFGDDSFSRQLPVPAEIVERVNAQRGEVLDPLEQLVGRDTQALVKDTIEIKGGVVVSTRTASTTADKALVEFFNKNGERVAALEKEEPVVVATSGRKTFVDWLLKRG